MAWRIAICDDEAPACQQLQNYLDQFSAQHREKLEIRTFFNAEDLLAAECSYDILLLDIQMGEMNGMNAARKLRQRGCQAIIFFITSMTRYAMEGYEVHAFSFLEKPIRYEIFAARMQDVLHSLKRSAGQTLTFHTSDGIIQVNTNEVCYIESFRHKIRFACLQFSFFESEATISDLSLQLAGCGFFRCHKSYLVNMGSIRLIGEDSISMLDGSSVPLSKHRRREFLSAYALYRKELL